MILKEMQPRGSGSGTKTVGGSQGRLVPVAAVARLASKGDKGKAKAVLRFAVSGYRNAMNAFIKDGPACAFVYSTAVSRVYGRYCCHNVR